MMATTQLIERGMDVLFKYLGHVEAEAFIAYIKTEHFDYTKWREDKFEDMTLHEIGQAASEYIKNHPFKGNAQII